MMMDTIKALFRRKPMPMKAEEFRIAVQKVLKDERRVTDVSFEPLPDGIERVYFYDSGIRANFLISPKKVDDKQTLALVVKAHAQTAFEVAETAAAVAIAEASELESNHGAA